MQKHIQTILWILFKYSGHQEKARQNGSESTKGLGGTALDPSKAQELEDGLVVPLGKPKTESGKKGDLLYNEYIVYNVEQIRMRYIVHLNFNFKTTS
ncbi:hypothetical protein AAZV13_02G015750 [Glycine max]